MMALGARVALVAALVVYCGPRSTRFKPSQQ
jgi:hypothetical protein